MLLKHHPKLVDRLSGSSYLIFARQISSDPTGSLLSNWVNQQVFPCK